MTHRPIYKRIHPCYYSYPGVLRIGDFFDPIEIEDPTGSIKLLIDLMDGSRTVEEIVSTLQGQYPSLSAEEVNQAIQDIDQLGFLYDQERELQGGLSEQQRDRFKGNLQFFSYFSALTESAPSDYQQKLCNAHVTILGMGAFGCSILMNLAGLGVRKIRIVDFDTVSLSNLNRQFLFNETNIGRHKVDVAKEYMANFYSDLELEIVKAEIRSLGDVETYMQDTHFLVLAADQPFFVISRWANKAAVKHRVPFITGGINVRVGQLYMVIPEVTACLDCTVYPRGEETPDFVPVLERLIDTDLVPPNMATAPTLQLITSMISMEIAKYLTGIAELESAGQQVRIDFLTFDVTKRSFKRVEEHCPTCGHGDGSQPIYQVYYKPEYQLRPVRDR